MKHMSKTDTEEKKLFNKVVIFVFKKLTCSFIKLKLNHCHMDYFNDVIATFLGLEHVSFVGVYSGSKSSWHFIKNILNCVPKMNEGLKGLERHD